MAASTIPDGKFPAMYPNSMSKPAASSGNEQDGTNNDLPLRMMARILCSKSALSTPLKGRKRNDVNNLVSIEVVVHTCG